MDAPGDTQCHRPHGSETQSGQLPPVSLKRTTSGVDFELWFLEFSNLYNLNLRRPDPKLSVKASRSQPWYSDLRFYNRLKYHFHHDQSQADRIRIYFDRGARDIHTEWVRKPMGESDVTPPHSDIPRATTEPERARLLDLLNTILDGLSPKKDMHSSPIRHEVPSFRESLAEIDPPSPSPRRQSKRPSDAGMADPPYSKRPRSAASNSDLESVLSRLDDGQVRAVTPVPSLIMQHAGHSDVPASNLHREGVYELPISANTSRTSFASRVFSEPDADHELPQTQETEVTVEASSQEKRRRPPPSSSSSSSFAPSSSTERALNIAFTESFNERSPLQSNVRQLLRRNGPSSHAVPSFSASSQMGSESNVDPIKIEPPSSSQSPVMYETEARKRLENIWRESKLPLKLQNAPLTVRWEITRIALHCGVAMDDLKFEYEPILNGQKALRERLRRLRIFQDKQFPEESRPEVWQVALNDTFKSTDQVVLFTATLKINAAKNSAPFILRLSPLKLDRPHRLDRRFGSDRFLELIMPSLYDKDIKKLGDQVENDIHQWLVRDRHIFLGRVWSSFYTKQADPAKLRKDGIVNPEVKTVMQDRIYCFAEDGNDFILPRISQPVSPKLETTSTHTKMSRGALLNWLLQIPKNESQSCCKLFSRIALGLSRTTPTIVLEPHQIRHRDEDILSPTNKVMNDGIARMSAGLAKKIGDFMGLSISDLPAAFQGRFGSAKGVWLRDTIDKSDEIWIETFPSQRKWECNYEEEDHRTFEVLKPSKELKSANLNLQLLPIFEDRAKSRVEMRQQVGNLLKKSLTQEIEAQKTAIEYPAQFRQWAFENGASSRRTEHIRHNQVPWTAGLPSSKDDQMNFLLVSGFDPKKLEFLQQLTYDLRRAKTEELRDKLNVNVGRSTYALMVIDFLGILKEDEVHLGFSSKFVDEDSGFSETYLDGMDILVARTPAHFPSDIQRVKAVHKTELGSLKDVIIFPRTGNEPLADKLSGGDYDGDIAWVCWEPAIVENFINAASPKQPDLFAQGILSKKKGTYRDIALSCQLSHEDVTTEFLDGAFRFNMQKNLLGTCTNYKEKFCYARNSVRDEQAIFLSTLISHLVDRAKQGIIFSEKDWNEQRKRLKNMYKPDANGLDPPKPQYKLSDWGRIEKPTQIIDYVKFEVGVPTVITELNGLKRSLGKAVTYDMDLVKYADHYEKLRRPFHERQADAQVSRYRKPNTWDKVLDQLTKDIHAVKKVWDNPRGTFNDKLSSAHEEWQKIEPPSDLSSRTLTVTQEETTKKIGLSSWDLLKASLCFKLYHARTPQFVWNMAGTQLGYLKSIAVTADNHSPPILMTPWMYAGSRPDPKFIRGVMAAHEGRQLEQVDEEPAEDDFDKESVLYVDEM
ncbi:hypothetical protein F5Y16DRAFT_278020 [Xylariaceae sp. FL0255]|nr:hypothetical protein F5Y16DRAFT_278020 [Xylariaceae sp. FL0255]